MTATLTQPETLPATEGDTPRAVERVLMLTHRLPYPPDRGDRIRSYHLLKTLSKHFEVAVACTSEEPVWLQHHQLLSTFAKRVVIQPISHQWSRVRGAAALLTGGAVTPACHYRRGLAEEILKWHEQRPFDAVLTFCTGMVHYARLLTTPGRVLGHKPLPRVKRHVLDLVDVDSLKWAAYARSTRSPMRLVYGAEARRLRRIELGNPDKPSGDHYDAITVVSDKEAEAYRQFVGEHPGLTVVRNGVDLNYFAPQPEPSADAKPHTIVFVGVLNYRPNAEGIAWFAREVMPLVRQRVPDATLQIVGRHPSQQTIELEKIAGVHVVGSVPDVRPHIRDAAAVVAPLLIARGVQNKVLEAMACRRAVVVSTGAAQGVEAVDGEHLLIANEPQQWATHLTTLLTDKNQRDRIAGEARRFVEAHCSWEESLRPMVKLLAGE